ncbi:hypothetical protein pdam_00008487, partial [Pocillopora damicornis]
MPEEVIPARVTRLRYTTMQQKLEYTCSIRENWIARRSCRFDVFGILSDNSLVMAKRAILREINAKSKNNLRFSFRTSTRFHVKIPLSSSHVNHPFGDSGSIFGHPEERKPKKTNRRYYPCRQDLRNHIAKAISEVKYCDDDQEALGEKIEDWQTKSPKSNFFYRTREAVINEKDEPRPRSAEETLLFVHQEPWQQQMLERYGSEPALMDAT